MYRRLAVATLFTGRTFCVRAGSDGSADGSASRGAEVHCDFVSWVAPHLVTMENRRPKQFLA